MPLADKPKTSESNKTQARQTVKPIPKLRDKIMSLPIINDTEVLILLLVKLLNNNLEENHTFINQKDATNTGVDLLYILAISLDKANIFDLNKFIFAIELEVNEQKTYK